MHYLENAMEAYVANDLEAWAPEISVEQRSRLARRVVTFLDSYQRQAECRVAGGKSLSWLYDPYSKQLLATYPSGASRVRTLSAALSARIARAAGVHLEG